MDYGGRHKGARVALRELPYCDIINPRRVDVLIGSLGQEDLARLYNLYLERARADLDDLLKHHARQDLVKALDAVHGLKGASANLGVVQVNQWAIAIEALLKLGIFDATSPLLPGLCHALEVAEDEIRDLLGL
jgi:HPt (histidine-containing phosphotransfer) domain-containing protein